MRISPPTADPRPGDDDQRRPVAEAAASSARPASTRHGQLDTLRPERFRLLTRSDAHARVLAGLDAVAAAGFAPGSLKIDTVVRDCNDDELPELSRRASAGERRCFIEYMDVGGATLWTRQSVVSRLEILDRIAARYGPPPVEAAESSSAPAETLPLPDGTVFGIIASATAPFCRACDRAG